MNAEIKRRVISAVGRDTPRSGGRPNNNYQQPQGTGKENQSDERAGSRPNSRPVFPKGKSKNAGKGKGPRGNRAPNKNEDLTPAEEAKVVAYIRNLKRRKGNMST